MDRIEGKGTSKGSQGKGKSDKGNTKGKSKLKDKEKGKPNSYDGEADLEIQCRTRASMVEKDKTCYSCGKTGNYARGCWHDKVVWNVQNVSNGGEVQHDQGQPSNQQPQTQQAPVSPSAQYRFSRISKMDMHVDGQDDKGHFVFDLRGSPQTLPKSTVSQ